jgi:RNA polymerase sigma-B factor
MSDGKVVSGADQALWKEYHAHHCPRLRERLVERYRPLARPTLRRLCHYCDDDMEQVAILGLVKAIDRFDPARENVFTTFAVPTIVGEVRHYLRDRCRFIRLPRGFQMLRERIRAKERELARATGRMPCLAEVAQALGVQLDHILEAMAADEQCHPLSLSAPIGSTDDGRPLAMEEMIGERDHRLERAEAEIAWAQMLEQLGPRLKRVIQLRYFGGLSQQEVGRRMGCSQMHVSRMERRALDQLRSSLAPG